MRLIRKFENNIIKRYKRFQYSYNQQFIERETLIKMLGRKAACAALKNSNYDPNDKKSNMEITPSEAIGGDYDFVPLGVSQMENKVVKSQQLLNFLNIIKGMPGFQTIVNLPLLIGKIWDLLGDADDKMILPQNTDPLMNPNDENFLITLGCDVPINPNDNDDEHLAIHGPLVVVPDINQYKISHIQKHMVSKQKKMMAAAQAQAGQGGAQPANFVPKPPPLIPAPMPQPPPGAA